MVGAAACPCFTAMTQKTQFKEASMAKMRSAKETHVRERLGTPTDLKPEATRDISAALAGLLADVFALYLKTKNFHWHMSGPHFRDYHLLLDEQGDQIFAMTDAIAERARKIGGTTLRSIGDIARRQRILDNDADYVDPKDMLAELRDDNKSLTSPCARSTTCATSTATSRPQACSRSGSTRPSGARGSCSRRPAAARGRTTEPGRQLAQRRRCAMIAAQSAVQPVWCDAPSPSPVSPLKYS